MGHILSRATLVSNNVAHRTFSEFLEGQADPVQDRFVDRTEFIAAAFNKKTSTRI
jgi:hypothetical protein